MDKNELKSLEEKAEAIVAALSDLEDETTRQKKMGDQLEQSKRALLSVQSKLSDAARNLAGAINLLQRSTLAEDIDRIDSKIDEVNDLVNLAKQETKTAGELCRKTTDLATSVEASARKVDDRLDDIRDSCNGLMAALEKANEEAEQRSAELVRRLDAFEEVIGRIDRNTQKGFGKERAKHAAW